MRKLRALAVVGSMLLVLVACAGANPSTTTSTSANSGAISGTLRLFSYSDGYAPAYMANFHKEYPNVNLQTSPFGNGDEAVAKIQAGFQADVVNSCVDENTSTMV